ncbi:MAG: DNA mismatch repair endonuclease MutL [Lachnospiraceae bacterium]|nr:DNA mismatch repair endonuclease MutL [Lachnospiraceae bacterium]
MPIKVLDSATIDQIAAGEVVERPSSIVKELVENAIDAGANAVTVEIKNGGIDFIRVTDNGCGIKASELRTAFLRHATSKIASADDLNMIKSLGFRGEALSSIAAVSQLEVITKTEESVTGVRMCMEGAEESLYEEIGAPTGTTMLIRNIFFNTPVRKKFLKSAAAEGSYIADLMEHLALSHPDISIQLKINSQIKFHTSGNGDLKEVIYRIYGRELANALVPVNVYKDGIAIHGFLGKPEQVRSNRNFEIYFINGRFIKSNVIARAIEEGYREHLMLHKFPVCFLHLQVDPENVDVNVHPTKMDVRFSDGPAFFATVSSVVYDALKNNEMIPGHVLDTPAEIKRAEKEALMEARSGKNPEPFEKSRVQQPSRDVEPVKKPTALQASALYEKVIARNEKLKAESLNKVEEDFFVDETVSKSDIKAETTKPEFKVEINAETNNELKTNANSESKIVTKAEINAVTEPLDTEIKVTAENSYTTEEPILSPDVKFEQTNLFEEKILTKENKSKYKIIGQVFETYWIVQYERKMFIIDQHAAHEKVNYERMMKRFLSKEIASQNIMPPLIVSLSGKEEAVFKENEQAFINLGFEVEFFGGNEYAIRAVPVDLYRHNDKELFLSVLDELAEGNSRGSYLSIEEKIADMACKASVKGGDKLTVAEAEALIDELLELDNPYNCPHGRPTIIIMSENEMEKKFKRIVN